MVKKCPLQYKKPQRPFESMPNIFFFNFQGQSDRSVTTGFREGLSTLDIRQSGNEDIETTRQRGIYVRRPGSRTSNTSEENTPTRQYRETGPFGHKQFRMIDASACDLRDPIGILKQNWNTRGHP